MVASSCALGDFCRIVVFATVLGADALLENLWVKSRQVFAGTPSMLFIFHPSCVQVHICINKCVYIYIHVHIQARDLSTVLTEDHCRGLRGCKNLDET